MLPLGKQLIVFDGGFGSELERRGLGEYLPEELNATHAEEIRAIHRAYAEAGADVITTNTFGLNRIKYRGKYAIADLARAAVENARAAGRAVFFDVGPTGALLAPIGTLSFDEAYSAFAEIAQLTSPLVDGYIVETFSDVYELKACILALKEHSDKPVYATVTFDATGRTLTGSTPEIVADILEGLGVDALGVNCSLGPKELAPVVERLLAATELPVVVQPNRGLPKLEAGRTTYDLSVGEFASQMEKFVSDGVAVVGGCCGTTPEFIARLAAWKGRAVPARRVEKGTAVCSATCRVVMDGVKICGERLNPTGKKKLKEALLAGDYAFLVSEAMRQQDAGADLLDLNVGIPKIDEPTVMRRAVLAVQEYVDLPLQIDSSDPAAIEAGVRAYNGIPLVNSVNGEEEVMARIFPVVKKYGAVVLGLTMDKGGVPRTAEERFEIAKRIVARAEEYGIPRRRVMIDTLVLTASAEQPLVMETVKALALVRSLGVKTALGVSNVSFGLPNRPLLNKTFLTMAMTCGLNMPILNPIDGEMTGAVNAFAVLSNADAGAEKYIEAYRDYVPSQSVATVRTEKREDLPAGDAQSLYECVKRGLKTGVRAAAEKELAHMAPLEVVNDVLVKALEEVGALYEKGTLFLPQLIASAEAAKEAFAVVGERMEKRDAGKGTVILATVRGDVHDIGKNIVKVVLQSYGYEVVDLGKDTPAETVVETAMRIRPLAVGLSALMTTTVRSMEETVRALRAAGCGAKIFVGGAVLTAEIAREIGADFYTANALEFVRVLDALIAEKK